jgi:hypothetical protein
MIDWQSLSSTQSKYINHVKYKGILITIIAAGDRFNIQGGAVNRGLKRFFSLYRPSCHIEAFLRPEKNCFVWAGPLANHHSILASFFLAAAERAVCFADLYRR